MANEIGRCSTAYSARAYGGEGRRGGDSGCSAIALPGRGLQRAPLREVGGGVVMRFNQAFCVLLGAYVLVTGSNKVAC